MGNLCGKESGADPFSQPGRTLATSPGPASGSVAVPSSQRQPRPSSKLTGTTQVVGGSNARSDGRPAATAAAEAAERRAGNKPKGKLATDLAAQKKKTRTDTLQEVSREGRQQKGADDVADLRNWS